MNKKLYVVSIILSFLICFFPNVEATDRWQSGFDTTKIIETKMDSVFTLDDVMVQIALHNPTLRAIGYKRVAVSKILQQATVWENPELSTDIEDVGWDAPGLSESEMTILLSQKFEFFGQRNARKQLAQTEIETVEFETELESYDLYVTAKRRFNRLLLAQRKVKLVEVSVKTAEQIVLSIENRTNQGVALQSELLLAQLELERIKLSNLEILQKQHAAQLALVALWNSESNDIVVSAIVEPKFDDVFEKFPEIINQIDSTRNLKEMQYKIANIQAEKKVVSKEIKPTLTFSAGYKRIEANNSNSLLFGVSLPLPLFNRNKSKISSLNATIQAQEYVQEATRLESKAYLQTLMTKINQLVVKHTVIDTLLLPTAQNVSSSLQDAFSRGRISYTSLLEAERSLTQLRFEQNEVLFNIYENIILLEQISGLRLY